MTGAFSLVDGRPVTQLTGTGFVAGDSGLVVTNHHVVAGAERIEIHTSGGIEVSQATVVASSECLDLALLDPGGDVAPDPSVWDEATVVVDEPVELVGYPEGSFDPAALSGVVTAARSPGATALTDVDETFEHSAVSDAGVSGSPVVGGDGAVLGMTFARTADGSAMLAVPAATVRSAIDHVTSGGSLPTQGLNVYALPDGPSSQTGVLVRGVVPGSAAATAGIRAGDVLLRIGGTSLSGDNTLATYCDHIRDLGAGAVVPVEVLRPDSAQLLVGEIGGRPLTDAFRAVPGG